MQEIDIYQPKTAKQPIFGVQISFFQIPKKTVDFIMKITLEIESTVFFYFQKSN